ncbi:hypothetical protein DsansV1_C02g0023921 [Dioscorea sansibarensis]
MDVRIASRDKLESVVITGKLLSQWSWMFHQRQQEGNCCSLWSYFCDGLDATYNTRLACVDGHYIYLLGRKDSTQHMATSGSGRPCLAFPEGPTIYGVMLLHPKCHVLGACHLTS